MHIVPETPRTVEFDGLLLSRKVCFFNIHGQHAALPLLQCVKPCLPCIEQPDSPPAVQATSWMAATRLGRTVLCTGSMAPCV